MLMGRGQAMPGLPCTRGAPQVSVMLDSPYETSMQWRHVYIQIGDQHTPCVYQCTLTQRRDAYATMYTLYAQHV